MPPNIKVATTSNAVTMPTSSHSSDQEEVFSWEQVYYYVSTNQIKSIHRSKKIQTVYDQWMKDTLAKHGSLENYLLTTKLHFPPTTKEDKDHPPVIILPNDFPYSVTQGINHILIWSQTPLSCDYTEFILETRYGHKSYEWVYWVNPPEIQSVRKLPHVHVFMRYRPE